MKLFRVILPVSDIEKASVFYSQLFKTVGQRVSHGRHYFNLGGTILALYDPNAEGDPSDLSWRPHANQYIYIATDELKLVHERIQNLDCLMVDNSIEVMPWGEKLFYAIDPFGNPICFVDVDTIFVGESKRAL